MLQRSASCGRLEKISQVWLVWGKAVALPRYQAYDFPRQPTITYDFVCSMVALGPGLAARRFLVSEISRLSVGYARLKKRSSSRKDPLDHRFHESAPMSGIHLGDEAL